MVNWVVEKAQAAASQISERVQEFRAEHENVDKAMKIGGVVGKIGFIVGGALLGGAVIGSLAPPAIAANTIALTVLRGVGATAGSTAVTHLIDKITGNDVDKPQRSFADTFKQNGITIGAASIIGVAANAIAPGSSGIVSAMQNLAGFTAGSTIFKGAQEVASKVVDNYIGPFAATLSDRFADIAVGNVAPALAHTSEQLPSIVHGAALG